MALHNGAMSDVSRILALVARSGLPRNRVAMERLRRLFVGRIGSPSYKPPARARL